jgi:hypothetical protein
MPAQHIVSHYDDKLKNGMTTMTLNARENVGFMESPSGTARKRLLSWRGREKPHTGSWCGCMHMGLVFLCFFVFSSPALAAAAIMLTEGYRSYVVGPKVEYLEDAGGRLAIHDVMSPDFTASWRASRDETQNFGYTDSAYWLRFNVKNARNHDDTVFLEIAYPLLSRVELFIPGEAESPSGHRFAGSLLPFGEREINHQNFIFRVPIRAGEEKSLYLRCASKSSMTIPLRLWSNQALIEKIYHEVYGFGLYYGGILILIAFNLFLYLSLRDPSYLLYVLHLACYGMFQLTLNGIAAKYVWPDFTWLNSNILPVFIEGAALSLIWFSQLFLQTAKQLPLLHKALSLQIIVSGLAAVVSFALPYSLSIQLAIVIMITGSIFLLVTAVLCLKSGFKPARLYLLAFAAFLSGVILMGLRSLGVLPANFWTIYGGQLGSGLQMVLLSVALGDRFKFMRDRAEAEIKGLNCQLQANLRSIEKIVEERTEAISAIINNVKSGFLIIDRNLKIEEGFTKSCEHLFGQRLNAGQNLADLLGLRARDKEHFEAAIEQIFDDSLPESVTLEQMPRFVGRQGKTLAFEAAVLRSRTRQVNGILFTITDSTALMEREREVAINNMLLHIVRYKNSFVHFIAAAKDNLASCREGLTQNNDLAVRVALHTVKGNSATYGLTGVRDLVHAIEERKTIMPEDIDRIEDELHSFVKKYESIIQLSWDRSEQLSFDIKKDFLLELHHSTFKHEKYAELAAAVRQWVREAQATPASHYLGPVHELVESLAVRLGKKVTFTLIGEDTLLDFPQQEKIMTNIIHLIRNALDHGIEEDRALIGKPEYGLIQLSIEKFADKFEITVADDGRGIDVSGLEYKALQSGKISSHEMLNLQDPEKVLRILTRGVSSRTVATDISGRGIGMVAIVETLHAIGGTLHIASERSKGCVIKISVPRRSAELALTA